MAQSKFKLTYQDEALLELVKQTDHRTLGVWAKACAERVLPYFEAAYPDDPRPRRALETLQAWIDTGEFRMASSARRHWMPTPPRGTWARTAPRAQRPAPPARP